MIFTRNNKTVIATINIKPITSKRQYRNLLSHPPSYNLFPLPCCLPFKYHPFTIDFILFSQITALYYSSILSFMSLYTSHKFSYSLFPISLHSTHWNKIHSFAFRRESIKYSFSFLIILFSPFVIHFSNPLKKYILHRYRASRSHLQFHPQESER